MEFLEAPVTLASFMKECLLSLGAGLMLAALMLLGAYVYFKVFKKKKAL